MSFLKFGFDENIQKGIEEAGFKEPTPVQSQCFDLLIRQNRDVYAQSQTGSGKTAAFLLSIFQLRLSSENYRNSKALIIVPTRELSVQIQNEAKRLGQYLNIAVGAVFGGGGYNAQERMLKSGVDILVGTPGRLIDFGRQARINFADFDFLVIDEADRLFDMGFIDDLRKIMNKMKPKNERRTMLFSATLSNRVGNLAWEYMDNPGEVIIEPEKVTVDTVIQELYHVGKDEKMNLLLGLLDSENPSNAVIFTNTRHKAWEVSKRLELNGYKKVIAMAGDIPQSKRLKIVDDLKKGLYNYMVATDVAARGLHIDELEMVINYDVPLEPESYVHRVGRTARAGRSGKTITLACEEYVYGLPPIEKLLGSKIPVKWANDSLIADDKSGGIRLTSQVRRIETENEKKGSASSHGKRKPHLSSKAPNQSQRHSTKTDKFKERAGKRQISRRVSKIQSTVSAVVGRNAMEAEELATETALPNAKTLQKNPRSKAGKKSSSSYKRSSVSGRKSTDKKSISHTVQSHSAGAKKTKDERIAYYASKYGESFKNQSDSGQGNSEKTPNQVSKSSGTERRVAKNQTVASKQNHAGRKKQPAASKRSRSLENNKISTVRGKVPKGAVKKKKRSFLSLLFGK